MAPSVVERNPVQADQADQPAIRAVSRFLNEAPTRAGGRPQLRGADGETLDLPEPIFRVLRQVAHILAQGDGVSILPVHKELTTQQAADILNVSRPYLIVLLDAGEIPFTLTGKHRRIKFGDLVTYKKKRDGNRRAQLAELTRLAEESGTYE